MDRLDEQRGADNQDVGYRVDTERSINAVQRRLKRLNYS